MNQSQLRDVAACDHVIAQQRAFKRCIQTATYGRIAAALLALPEGGSYCTPYMSDGQITFYVTIGQLQTFADPRLSTLLETLAKPALRLSGESMTEDKNAFQRSYYFAAHVADIKIRIVLSAYESEETSSCQRVLVGMKTIEQPVYEYKCLDVIATEIPAPVLLEGL